MVNNRYCLSTESAAATFQESGQSQTDLMSDEVMGGRESTQAMDACTAALQRMTKRDIIELCGIVYFLCHTHLHSYICALQCSDLAVDLAVSQSHLIILCVLYAFVLPWYFY